MDNRLSLNHIPHFKNYIDRLMPSDLSESEKNETYRFFLQVIKYCISHRKPVGYFFIVEGEESTGKTFFLDIIKKSLYIQK